EFRRVLFRSVDRRRYPHALVCGRMDRGRLMGLLIGGKTIDQASKRTIASKPIDLSANNARDLELYGDVNRDPFTAHADWSPGMRASFLIDTAIALEQGLEGTAATARKVASMRRKPADPANEGAPG